MLLEALEREAGLGPLGRLGAHGNLLQHLKNRLLVVDYLKRNPDAAALPIEAPIVIAGLPRTGTTHLHNLMAADPSLRGRRLESIFLGGGTPSLWHPRWVSHVLEGVAARCPLRHGTGIMRRVALP